MFVSTTPSTLFTARIVRYLGIDVHKDTAYVYAVDEKGKRLFSRKVSMNEEFDRFAATLLPSDHVALEATSNAFALYDLLAGYAGEVVAETSFRV